MTATLELREIDKSFPGVRALSQVSLTVQAGRIHALLGENGAGKSTLIKIAAGALRPDAGLMLMDGRTVDLTPASARDHGIRVVHQERQILPTRTIADNLVLDSFPRNRFGLVTRRSVRKEAASRLERLGLALDLDAPVSTLTVAQTQMLEIARAVDFRSKCVIMDEPSASLHRSELDQLFQVARAIREHGIAIVYISHHLDEVMALADDYTVLRNGRSVASGQIANTTPTQLVSEIFGSAVSLNRDDVIGDASTPGDLAVNIRGVSYGNAVKDVTLDLRFGEVVVVTGAVGSGASQVGQLVASVISPTRGDVRIQGNRLRGRHRTARAGVAFLPADRKREGLMLERAVAENIRLAEYAISHHLMASPRATSAEVRALCRDLQIKVSDLSAPVRNLSGGNQQRVALARWLKVKSRILVLDEPTVGVDIPSKLAIYKIIRDLATGGAAVLIISTEYQEIHSVADRVVVMRDGVIVGELSGEDATEDRLFELELGL